ncbi:MAG: hypothetical protein D6732_19620, partial [Methanobacteriota archaeon]
AIPASKGWGYFATGQMLVKEGLPEQADTWFATAIQQNPDNKEWWLVRANTARGIGRVDESLHIYQDAAKRFPDWAELYYEMAWGWKIKGEAQKAIGAIEQSISLSQGIVGRYHYRAGQIFEWHGDLEDALNAYLMAVTLLPHNRAATNALQRLRLEIETEK